MNFFNAEGILRLTPINSDTVTIADKILKKDIKIFPSLESIRVDNFNDLWELQFPEPRSTYALYVYALYPVSYLLNAYEVTSSVTYLEQASNIAEDFLAWESSNKKTINKKRRKILFGDHAVSNRTQCFCYLAACAIDAGKELPQSVARALLENGDYLANSENYHHYNHGLMMDLALLGLLNTLNGLDISYPSRLKENLLARMRHSITRDLTQEGVHIENSPGYHLWMLRFLQKVVQPLSALDEYSHVRACEAARRATVYAEHITRPDGSVPTIGDTHIGVRFRPSKGLKTMFFRDANQVIFRTVDDTIWAYLSSGYKTHVHKHHDNGVFNLYYNGADILIDPGFLDYENSQDSLRIKSSEMHNIVRPQAEEQRIQHVGLDDAFRRYDDNISDSRVAAFCEKDGTQCALAKIADYDSGCIERMVVFFRSSIFILYDRYLGGYSPLEQFFHVSPALNPVIVDDCASIFDGSGHLVCQITQHAFEGDEDKQTFGQIEPALFAKKFGVKGTSKRILYRTDRQYLVTSIQLGAAHKSFVEMRDSAAAAVAIHDEETVYRLRLTALRDQLLQAASDSVEPGFYKC